MSQGCRTNPFVRPPKPIPCDPFEGDSWGASESPTAREVFSEDVLPRVIDGNAAWLQYQERRTHEIRMTLFPHFIRAGMTNEEIGACINWSMFDAGYQPRGSDSNPSWVFGADGTA